MYSPFDTATQEEINSPRYPLDDEPLDILEIADPIVSVAEACAFQRRIDRRLTFSELRRQICLDYELGFVDAKNTLKRLWDNQLIRNADDLAFLVAAGVRAIGEGE